MQDEGWIVADLRSYRIDNKDTVHGSSKRDENMGEELEAS